MEGCSVYAMANLMFVFEVVSMYPELQEEFDSGIIDLLGIRRLDSTKGNYVSCLIHFLQRLFQRNSIHSKPDKR